MTQQLKNKLLIHKAEWDEISDTMRSEKDLYTKEYQCITLLVLCSRLVILPPFKIMTGFTGRQFSMAWVRGWFQMLHQERNLDPPTRIHTRLPAALRIACHRRCGRRHTGCHSSDGSDRKYSSCLLTCSSLPAMRPGSNRPQPDTGVGDPCSRQQAELIRDEQRVPEPRHPVCVRL